MRFLRTIKGTAGSFGKDANGNFGVVCAVAASALMMSVGYGINITQLYHVKSDLAQALDAAVMSTARDLTTGVIAEEDARGMVEAFLTANSGTGFASAESISLDRLVVNRVQNTVEASASVDVAIAFPLFGGSSTRRVAVESASLYSDKQIEVAMMLDVTGSMAGHKIEDLKTAATNAVELLLGGQNSREPRVRVALIPYAEAVNVGALAEDTVFIERRDRSDLPPPISASEHEIRKNTGRWEDNCATERKDESSKTDFSDDGPDTVRRKAGDPDYKYYARVNRDDHLGDCPDAVLQPLTADADELKDAIDDFSASGVTGGGIGVQWAYYMLSPKWRDAIRDADLGDGPQNHDRDEVSKIAIIMTDGLFNSAFVGEGRDGKARSKDNAEGLCEAMKDDGIKVFTIGFALDDRDVSREERRQARAVLQNCASEDTSSIQHFYEASTGEELDETYKEIIRNMEQLYLTM